MSIKLCIHEGSKHAAEEIRNSRNMLDMDKASLGIGI